MIYLNTTTINPKEHIEDGVNYGRHIKIDPKQITDDMLAAIFALDITALTLTNNATRDEIDWNINWNFYNGSRQKENLDFLRNKAFEQIRYLNCQANYLGNISAIADLPHLEYFKCHAGFHGGFDFSKIKSVNSMKKLSLSYSLGDVKGLSKCKQLEHLTIFYYKHIPGAPSKDMGDFAPLTNLKYLDFRNSHVHTLDGLQYLTNLETLKISHLFNLKTIAALKGNKNIRHLTISHCEQIEDIGIVETLPNLESFNT